MAFEREGGIYEFCCSPRCMCLHLVAYASLARPPALATSPHAVHLHWRSLPNTLASSSSSWSQFRPCVCASHSFCEPSSSLQTSVRLFDFPSFNTLSSTSSNEQSEFFFFYLKSIFNLPSKPQRFSGVHMGSAAFSSIRSISCCLPPCVLYWCSAHRLANRLVDTRVSSRRSSASVRPESFSRFPESRQSLLLQSHPVQPLTVRPIKLVCALIINYSLGRIELGRQFAFGLF